MGSNDKKTITSPVTARIFLLLLERPRSTTELAEELGLKSKEVWGYLHYYYRKGWVTRNSFLWALTEQGRRVAEKYREHFEWLIKLFSGLYKDSQFFYESKDFERCLKRTNSFRPEPKLIHEHSLMYNRILERVHRRFKRFLGREPLAEELCVLRYLTDFYIETGSEYWYPPEWLPGDSLASALARVLSSSGYCSASVEQVSSALQVLKSLRVVALFIDERLRIPKIRLDKSILGR